MEHVLAIFCGIVLGRITYQVIENNVHDVGLKRAIWACIALILIAVLVFNG